MNSSGTLRGILPAVLLAVMTSMAPPAVFHYRGTPRILLVPLIVSSAMLLTFVQAQMNITGIAVNPPVASPVARVDQFTYYAENRSLFFVSVNSSLVFALHNTLTLPLLPSVAAPWQYAVVAGSNGTGPWNATEVPSAEAFFASPTGVVGWPFYAVGPKTVSSPSELRHGGPWVGLWVCDSGHNAVRFVHFDRGNNVTSVAGDGSVAGTPRDGVGAASRVIGPTSAAWGRLFISVVQGTAGSTTRTKWTSVVYWTLFNHHCVQQGVPLSNRTQSLLSLSAPTTPTPSALSATDWSLNDMVLNVTSFAGVCSTAGNGMLTGSAYQRAVFKNPWGIALVNPFPIPVSMAQTSIFTNATSTSANVLFVGEYGNGRLSMITPMYPVLIRVISVIYTATVGGRVDGVTIGKVQLYEDVVSIVTVVDIFIAKDTVNQQRLMDVALSFNYSKLDRVTRFVAAPVIKTIHPAMGSVSTIHSVMIPYAPNSSYNGTLVILGGSGVTALQFYCCLGWEYSEVPVVVGSMLYAPTPSSSMRPTGSPSGTATGGSDSTTRSPTAGSNTHTVTSSNSKMSPSRSPSRRSRSVSISDSVSGSTSHSLTLSESPSWLTGSRSPPSESTTRGRTTSTPTVSITAASSPRRTPSVSASAGSISLTPSASPPASRTPSVSLSPTAGTAPPTSTLSSTASVSTTGRRSPTTSRSLSRLVPVRVAAPFDTLSGIQVTSVALTAAGGGLGSSNAVAFQRIVAILGGMDCSEIDPPTPSAYPLQLPLGSDAWTVREDDPRGQRIIQDWQLSGSGNSGNSAHGDTTLAALYRSSAMYRGVWIWYVVVAIGGVIFRCVWVSMKQRYENVEESLWRRLVLRALGDGVWHRAGLEEDVPQTTVNGGVKASLPAVMTWQGRLGYWAYHFQAWALCLTMLRSAVPNVVGSIVTALTLQRGQIYLDGVLLLIAALLTVVSAAVMVIVTTGQHVQSIEGTELVLVPGAAGTHLTAVPLGDFQQHQELSQRKLPGIRRSHELNNEEEATATSLQRRQRLREQHLGVAASWKVVRSVVDALRWWALPRATWVPRKLRRHPTYVNVEGIYRLRLLDDILTDFTPMCSWFTVIDFLLTVMMSIVGSIRSPDADWCQTLSYVQITLAAISTLVLLLLRPYASFMQLHFAILTTFCSLVISILVIFPDGRPAAEYVAITSGIVQLMQVILTLGILQLGHGRPSWLHRSKAAMRMMALHHVTQQRPRGSTTELEEWLLLCGSDDDEVTAVEMEHIGDGGDDDDQRLRLPPSGGDVTDAAGEAMAADLEALMDIPPWAPPPGRLILPSHVDGPEPPSGQPLPSPQSPLLFEVDDGDLMAFLEEVRVNPFDTLDRRFNSR